MRGRAVLVSGMCLVVAASVAGCAAGPVSPEVQTGRADVNADGTGGSIETSDWTYGLPTNGITWVDQQGALHDTGRPDCLVPGTSTEVSFAAIRVQLGTETLRPVVWISCQ